jgi:crotonobetainyl-CoA:carnitine CoA-transferase CaiB-like acyl-CoA transferase
MTSGVEQLAATGAGLPLAGITVLDLTMVWAGPYATKLLADMGATVIKVESPDRIDPIRMATIEIFMLEAPDMATKPYNRSAYFNEYNRNKLSLTIDTRDPRGAAVLEDLVRRSDVLVENFRPGVLARLGLGDDALAALNPGIIRVSMPAYSATGSESRQVGYGPNIEEMSGLTRLNGYPDAGPMKTGISFADPMAGIMAAAASVLALIRRQRSGVASRVEVSQRDILVSFIGEAVLEWAMNEAEPERTGNRSTVWAPQGCYRCAPLAPGAERRLDVYHSAGQGAAAAERWVTISATTDAEWASLCDAMGRSEMASDPRYRTAEQRLAAHDELDTVISAWTAGLSDLEVVTVLQQRGVPAGRVMSCLDIASDPHLEQRGFLETVLHPQVGETRVTAPVWRLHRNPAQVRRHAPCLGEDNAAVLGEVLGMSPDDIAELDAAGVTATTPRF